MAVGDVFNNLQSVAGGAVLDARPPVGVEAVIHNVYHENAIRLYYTDDTLILWFDTDDGRGIYAKFSFHVTNTRWLRIVNATASVYLIGYDGVVTK